MKLIAISYLGAVLLAAPAIAQVAQQPEKAADQFAMIDVNKDGALSLAEIQKVDKKVTQDDFARYDADADRKLTNLEFAKWASDLEAQQSGKQG